MSDADAFQAKGTNCEITLSQWYSSKDEDDDGGHWWMVEADEKERRSLHLAK